MPFVIPRLVVCAGIVGLVGCLSEGPPLALRRVTDDAANTIVPLLAYYADAQSGHDPAHGYVQDEIALVPQAALAASKTYRVDIAAVVKGTMTNLSWKFTTGTRNE